MKTALYLLAVICGSGIFQPALAKVDKQKAVDSVKKCLREHVMDEAGLREVLSSGPKTRSQKCFCACCFKGVNILKNGAFNPSGVRDVLMMMRQPNNMAEQLSTMVSTCQDDVISSDECEMAAEMIECLYKKGLRLGGGGGGEPGGRRGRPAETDDDDYD